VVCTLAIDGWAVTFGTARRGLGGLQPLTSGGKWAKNYFKKYTHANSDCLRTKKYLLLIRRALVTALPCYGALEIVVFD